MVRVQSRRQYPELVTREPAPDDEEVYGAAWPLVEEWRRLREGHPNDGRSLSWLVTEERILNLELAMAEEHGLTLPPETQPLTGVWRNWQRRSIEAARATPGGRGPGGSGSGGCGGSSPWDCGGSRRCVISAPCLLHECK